MIDFADTGEIGLLIDGNSVALREATIGSGGILPGKELAFTFGTLRANDLIWRYVVESYLKGAPPDTFDLLYWDSDSVSLPGPMYCWYARNAYVENKIKEPGATTQCGERIDLSKVKVPMFCSPLARTISCLGRARFTQRTSWEEIRALCSPPAVTLRA